MIVLLVCGILAAVALASCFIWGRIRSISANIHRLREEEDGLRGKVASLQYERDMYAAASENTRTSLDEAYNKLTELNQTILSKREELAYCESTVSMLRQSAEHERMLMAQEMEARRQLLENEVMAAHNKLVEEMESRRIDAADSFAEELDAYEGQRQLWEQELKKWRNRVSVEKDTYHTAWAHNHAVLEDEARHYLGLTDRDRGDLDELMRVCGKLRNPVPVYKAIYDVYFKTSVGVMAQDIGANGVCGIYLLTDRTNGKVYVGQSVNIGDRWRQHVRRGCGAEVGTIAGGKLYGAMMEHGVWNFKFEVLEVVDKDSLTEREKYWIHYFNSVENGYNSKG